MMVFGSEPGFVGDTYVTVDAPGTGGDGGQIQIPVEQPATQNPPTPGSPTPTPPATIPGAPTVRSAPVPVPTPRAAPSTMPAVIVEGTGRYSATDYAHAARGLLPRGRAWAEGPDSVLSQLLVGIGAALASADAAANGILSGVRPGELSGMLAEWEATLGLPSGYLGDPPTIAHRLNRVRGRFIGTGGQSRQRYTEFAAALGFQIEIAAYAPSMPNLPAIGLDADDPAWMFVWSVEVVTNTGSLSTGTLMEELERIKPAETTIILLD